jgi:hypothetical protein
VANILVFPFGIHFGFPSKVHSRSPFLENEGKLSNYL